MEQAGRAVRGVTERLWGGNDPGSCFQFLQEADSAFWPPPSHGSLWSLVNHGLHGHLAKGGSRTEQAALCLIHSPSLAITPVQCLIFYIFKQNINT